MMMKYSCIFVMLILSGGFSTGQPVPDESKNDRDKGDGSLFNLPFLQFGNGGVRVNFAGYHAQAGLGGLLSGDSTKGGLYAGAGTPFGAHASADLGGDLGGDKGGGGLRASAGLGNGGPAAAAGLGGNLDGSNIDDNGGTAYAGSSNGARTKVVTKNVGKDQTNIQIIPNKSSGGEGEMVRRDIGFLDEKINAVEPIPLPVVTEAAFSSAYPSRRCRRKRLCNNFLQKTLTYQQLPGNKIAPDFGIYKPLPEFPGEKDTGARGFVEAEVSAGVGGISADAAGYDVAVAPGPAPAPPSTSQPAADPTPAPTFASAPVPVPVYPHPYPHPLPHPYPVKFGGPTLFDHIFNIPISTLAAVNQLLNSKVG